MSRLFNRQHKGPDAASDGSGHGHQEVPPVSDQTLQAPPPIAARPDLDAVKRMRLEMGTTPVEFAAEHIEDARPELLEAMKWLDSTEDRELHVRLGNVVNELDDIRAGLRGRL